MLLLIVEHKENFYFELLLHFPQPQSYLNDRKSQVSYTEVKEIKVLTIKDAISVLWLILYQFIYTRSHI